MTPPPESLSNAQIAARLAALAQLLSAQKENFYKVKAYQRAAAKIRTLSESVADLVREGADLTIYAGIGDAISQAVREIVLTGTLSRLEKLRSEASPELAGLSDYPRLDPKRVLRIYRKLGISTVDELRASLESGELESAMSARIAQHVRQGMTESHAILLYRADELAANIEDFLLNACRARRVQVAGAYRRRVETIEELSFLVDTEDFTRLVARVERYGGGTPMLYSGPGTATFALSAGIYLCIDQSREGNWGYALVRATGSEAHLRKLEMAIGGWKTTERAGPYESENDFYGRFGLAYIDPEIREGRDEIDLASHGRLPSLVTPVELRGELHAHSSSSDGLHSIEQMAAAAREFGYEYIGITDHSQSLKIARGVPVEALWEQIRFIDRLNERSGEIRILKSAEVDILADGALDYPDDLLRELDYTVCSVHSRFALGRAAQTERILRAMDNRRFNILGHATGRLLLKRPGYEVDFPRLVEHARECGCFFEINSSPDRLDVSSENARIAHEAGVMIAVSTDAHGAGEFGTVRYGVDQARRAGLSAESILNCLPWERLRPLFRR